MMDFWRFPNAADPATTPDWVLPFLELDEEWNQGRAQGRSSGSTGAPKSVEFKSEAVTASARATSSHFGLEVTGGRSVTVWSALPAAGIGGRMMWWRSRILGWQLTQSRPSSTPSVPPPPDGLDRYDFAAATPQQAAHLATAGWLDRIRILLLGGGTVPPALEVRLIEAARTTGCRIHHGFGMTETLTHIATRELGEDIYRPVAGVELDQRRDGALVVTDASRGIRSLDTRDAVRPCVEGLQSGFHWLGRLDLAINTGGVKVHPEAMEMTLAGRLAPLLRGRRWFLTGRPHPVTGEQVTLIIEGPPDTALGKACLTAAREDCNDTERPRAVEWRERFEETGTGKVRRH